MPGFLFNGLFLRIAGIAGIALAVAGFLQMRSCDKKKKDNQRIEHNSEKRDEYVEKEISPVKTYQQNEKIKLQEAKKIVTINNLRTDYGCVSNFLVKCKGDEENCKREAAKACHRPKKKYNQEELKKIRDKHFLELEGLSNN